MNKSSALSFLHSLGLRRTHAARQPLRSLARALAHRKIIPLEALMGADLETTFQMRFHNVSFQYHVGPKDNLGARFFWQDWIDWEPHVIPCFAKMAKTARRVLDVGAHTGVYSLFACALNDTAQVLSFEPLCFGCDSLRYNLRLNGFESRCEVFGVAVSDTVGSARFQIAEDATMSHLIEDGSGIKVDVITLDSVVPLDGRTDLVKIDIEGHELKALLGMQKVIADSHPAIVFECNPGSPGLEIHHLLRGYGYKVFHPSDGSLVEVPELVPERFPDRRHNFLAILPSHFELASVSNFAARSQ